MASPRVRTFEKALASEIVTMLDQRGFIFDGRRTFRRREYAGDLVEIVDFQIGVRSMEGLFTVNLAVFDPARATIDLGPGAEPNSAHPPPHLRERLGHLTDKPALLTRAFRVLASRIILRRTPDDVRGDNGGS